MIDPAECRGDLFDSRRDWELHINQNHVHEEFGPIFNDDEEFGFIFHNDECPLCRQSLREHSKGARLSHLAHHMEQIALLAFELDQGDKQSTRTVPSSGGTESSVRDQVSIDGWSSSASSMGRSNSGG